MHGKVFQPSNILFKFLSPPGKENFEDSFVLKNLLIRGFWSSECVLHIGVNCRVCILILVWNTVFLPTLFKEQTQR